MGAPGRIPDGHDNPRRPVPAGRRAVATACRPAGGGVVEIARPRGWGYHASMSTGRPAQAGISSSRRRHHPDLRRTSSASRRADSCRAVPQVVSARSASSSDWRHPSRAREGGGLFRRSGRRPRGLRAPLAPRRTCAEGRRALCAALHSMIDSAMIAAQMSVPLRPTPPAEGRGDIARLRCSNRTGGLAATLGGYAQPDGDAFRPSLRSTAAPMRRRSSDVDAHVAAVVLGRDCTC